ncbi:2-amino-4-hydroxy-6-hydroxymethyldihydropteridine diphosphokinase [Olivibacter ginsenosidimutans]|uniref:2-amino-4-hydroxy-6-hydroxymethyldihydropteridine pyrophosphokinase n=1 Tax=Olivibacter ginsenosidimutans TaxID=1176537 RepID=A0ABP9BI19_9SPHI
MHEVYVILGSNLGDSSHVLGNALHFLTERVGTVVAKSPIYQTAPWGVANQPDYLNQVIRLKTSLKPEEVLEEVLNIEKDLGRTRLKKWEARIIDIDILFYDHAVIQRENLVIPHPLLHLRKFVLEPLAAIAPDFIHPVLQQTVGELLAHVGDEHAVRRASL